MTANPLITEGRDLGWGLMDQFGAVRALSSLARVCRGCALYCRLPWVCATLPYAVGVRGTAVCRGCARHCRLPSRSPLAARVSARLWRPACKAVAAWSAAVCAMLGMFRPRDGGRHMLGRNALPSRRSVPPSRRRAAAVCICAVHPRALCVMKALISSVSLITHKAAVCICAVHPRYLPPPRRPSRTAH